MTKISGKIAAIFNDRSLVINRGAIHGVMQGMIFAIQLLLPNIKDPDDPSNILDGLFYEKGRIKVDQIFEKMSFASLIPLSGKPTLGTLSEKISFIYPTVDKSELITANEWLIKVNDSVTLIEEHIHEQSTLEIIKAIYGTEAAEIDVTQELKNSVLDNKLDIVASNAIKGDPAPGKLKKLTIEYKVSTPKITKIFTEGDKVMIP